MSLMSPHILSSILHLPSSAFSDDDACIHDATSDKIGPCLYTCVLVVVVCRVGGSVTRTACYPVLSVSVFTELEKL